MFAETSDSKIVFPPISGASKIMSWRQTSRRLVVYGVGRTIIKAVAGDHETLLHFPQGIEESNYQSEWSDGSWNEWIDSEYWEYSESEESILFFLSGLCVQVAGYVGESVFGEQDALVDCDKHGWHRVGRGDLCEALHRCEVYATASGVSTHEVLEACMHVVDSTLRKYQRIANTMCLILDAEGHLDGYRLAALLSEIKTDDLSVRVRERLGIGNT